MKYFAIIYQVNKICYSNLSFEFFITTLNIIVFSAIIFTFVKYLALHLYLWIYVKNIVYNQWVLGSRSGLGALANNWFQAFPFSKLEQQVLLMMIVNMQNFS